MDIQLADGNVWTHPVGGWLLIRRYRGDWTLMSIAWRRSVRDTTLLEMDVYPPYVLAQLANGWALAETDREEQQLLLALTCARGKGDEVAAGRAREALDAYREQKAKNMKATVPVASPIPQPVAATADIESTLGKEIIRAAFAGDLVGVELAQKKLQKLGDAQRAHEKAKADAKAALAAYHEQRAEKAKEDVVATTEHPSLGGFSYDTVPLHPGQTWKHPTTGEDVCHILQISDDDAVIYVCGWSSRDNRAWHVRSMQAFRMTLKQDKYQLHSESTKKLRPACETHQS